MHNFAPTLCPPSSWLHECYSTEFLQKVRVVAGPAEWGTCTRTVSCHQFVLTLAYWNNTIAASLANDSDITTFDALTGTQTATISGHTNCYVSRLRNPLSTAKS